MVKGVDVLPSLLRIRTVLNNTPPFPDHLDFYETFETVTITVRSPVTSDSKNHVADHKISRFTHTDQI